MPKRGRDGLPLASEEAPAKVLIGFDFDCTLTIRHFFKVFAHGYMRGDMGAHQDCPAFAEWCNSRGVPTKMGAMPPGLWSENIMGGILEGFCRKAGEARFRELFREVFLGGEARINMVAAQLRRLAATGAEFAIVTAGISGTVLRGLSCVPEWREFFPLSRVWDVSQARHKAGSVMAMKAMLLRDLCPCARRIVLVDDSLEKDEPPAWTLEVSQVEMFRGKLPYEGPGLNSASLSDLEQLVLGELARGDVAVSEGTEGSVKPTTAEG